MLASIPGQLILALARRNRCVFRLWEGGALISRPEACLDSSRVVVSPVLNYSCLFSFGNYSAEHTITVSIHFFFFKPRPPMLRPKNYTTHKKSVVPIHQLDLDMSLYILQTIGCCHREVSAELRVSQSVIITQTERVTGRQRSLATQLTDTMTLLW